MEVEVMTSSPAVDSNLDSACTSPYISSPSTPYRFFYSAPTSPGYAAGTPKTKDTHNTSDDYDFEFDFSGQLERTSLSADELFDGGKIRPLNQLTKRAIEESKPKERERGRERTYNNSSSASNLRPKGTARSLSPFRVRDIFLETETETENENETYRQMSNSSTEESNKKGFKKWRRLRDFFLFRSSSEGRATRKETLKNYWLFNKEVKKNWIFRSVESSVGGGSVSLRKGDVSAHELHYTVNRAVSEEMRKKTFLPYNHGLLLGGCMGFNPVVHDLTAVFGSQTRG